MFYKLFTFFDIEAKRSSLPVIAIVSIFIHVSVFVIIPLLLTLFWKPEKFERPETIQLVTIKQVQKQELPKPAPKPKPDPKPKDTPKPIPKSEPEPEPDLSDLEDLFAAPTVQTSSLSAVQTIPNRYLIALKSKVEAQWNPSLRDSTIKVIVAFTISLNGALDGAVTVKKSSGKAVIDRQAVRAIELAAPFPSLPPNFRSEKLELSYTLIPYEG